MKERIIQIAKGDITNGEIAFQVMPKQLTGTLPEGGKVRKELEIRTLTSKPVNGVAYSDCPNVRIKHNQFKGYRSHLYVEFDCTGWKDGDVLEGNITLVTVGGEQTVLYTFHIQSEKATVMPAHQKNREENQLRGKSDQTADTESMSSSHTAEEPDTEVEASDPGGSPRTKFTQVANNQMLSQFWKLLLDAFVHDFGSQEMEELEFELLVCREEHPDCMPEVWMDLWQIFILYHTGRNEEGMKLHESLASSFAEEESKQEESYLFWLYLQDRLLPEKMRGGNLPEMEQFWRREGRWTALLYLSEMDLNRFYHHDGVITECCGLYDKGVHSPLLLWKLCRLLIEHPMGFTIERSGMLEALHFGYRYGMPIQPLLEKAGIQLREGKEVAHEAVLLRILQGVLKKQETASEELWEQTILLMQRRGCVGETWFYWYHQAALRHVKAEGLAELYLRALPQTYRKAIARPVVLYYTYGDALEQSLREVLYTNVQIFYREEEAVYAGYRNRIEAFMLEHLMHRDINLNLQYLYAAVLQPELLDAHLARCTADVLSMEHIQTTEPDAVKVRIQYPYLKRTWEYPLQNGEGDVMVWNQDAILDVVTSDGIHKGTEGIARTVWMENAYLDERCRSFQAEHLRYRLNWVAEKIAKGVSTAEEAKQLIDAANALSLTEEAVNRIVSVLLVFGEQHPEESVCDGVLLGADPLQLSISERECILRLLLQKGYEKAAIEQIQRYGWQGLSVSLLTSLMETRQKRGGSPEQWDVSMCAMLYQAGARAVWLLELLCQYWNHGQAHMYGLLQECRKENYEIKPILLRALAERLLIQSLFCGEWDNLPEVMGIYKDCQGNSLLLEQAYLAARCHTYYMTGGLDAGLEHWFAHSPLQEPFREKLPEICSMALLQWHQSQSFHTEEAVQLCRELLSTLIRKNRYYAFFHGFTGIAEMPRWLSDKVILEYHGQAGSCVTLYYKRDKLEDEEHSVVMEEQFSGVYCAAVTLFAGEQMTYRLCTEEGEQDVTLAIPEPFPSENRFARELNQAIGFYRQGSWQEARTAICRLEMKEYICAHLFAVQEKK